MGGKAPFAGGDTMRFTSGTWQYFCLTFSPAVTGTNIVNANTIANIHYTTTFSGAGTPLTGIRLFGSADFTLGAQGNGNMIENITLTNNGTFNSEGFRGVMNLNSGINSIAYNTIRGITVNGTKDGALTILIENNDGTTTIDNNILGGSAPNNIFISSNSAFVATYNNSASGITFTNNTIQNIDHNASTEFFFGLFNEAGPLTYTGNIIQNISIASDNLHSMVQHSGLASGAATISNNIFQNITLKIQGSMLLCTVFLLIQPVLLQLTPIQ